MGDAEADWIGQRGEPRCSLEDRDCQGMPLTTVSNAWREDGRKHGCRRRKTESRTARFRAGPRHGTRQGPGRRNTRAFGWRGRKTTCGLRQRGPSSKPFAASAIAPGPFRGWGRKPWRASAHKGARCSAGGHRHGIPSGPRGLLTLARRQGVRKPLRDRRQGTPIKGMAAGAIRGAMTFSPRPMAGRRARTPLQKETRFGVPRGAGRLPRRQ